MESKPKHCALNKNKSLIERWSSSFTLYPAVFHSTCHNVFTDCTTVIYQVDSVINPLRASVAMLFEWLPARLHCFFVFFSPSQILLDANTIQLGSLPLGIYTPSPSQASQEQAVYEVCVCPSGKIYLSPAEGVSTCQAMSNICLWSWPGQEKPFHICGGAGWDWDSWLSRLCSYIIREESECSTEAQDSPPVMSEGTLPRTFVLRYTTVRRYILFFYWWPTTNTHTTVLEFRKTRRRNTGAFLCVRT